MAIRPTEAVVNLAALKNNFKVLQAQCPAIAIAPVIKANAYGHGAPTIAAALETCGAPYLIVSLIEEGVELRQAGIQIPILVAAGILEHAYREICEYQLTPVIYQAEHLAQWQATNPKHPLHVHLKVDTGMNRLGISVQELPLLCQQIAHSPAMHLEGLMTHLTSAQHPDGTRTREQLEQLRQALAPLPSLPRWIHAANSAGYLQRSAATAPPYTMARLGLSLFGISPLHTPHPQLEPILSWRTRPIQIQTIASGARVSYNGNWCATRPSRIATLPAGYADGYPRRAAGRAHVLIEGQRAPLLGDICMDLCMIDITDIPSANLQSEVVLLGRQGQQTLSANELAAWAHTIPYEILTQITVRVPRVYRHEAPCTQSLAT